MTAHADPPRTESILFIIPCPLDVEDTNKRPPAFELEIPLADLRQLVLRPIRWLKLIAWGILNCTGQVLDQVHETLHDDLPFDQLSAGATYRFLPYDGATFSLMNLEHFRAKSSTRQAHPAGSLDSGSKYSAGSTSSDDTASARLDELLAARDGGICIFSGDDCVNQADVLPRQFARNSTSLHAIAQQRGFHIETALDVANRLTIDIRMQDFWARNKCFILATDPAFVRDQDVPKPRSPPLGSAEWLARAEPAGETFIWQSLEQLLGPRTGLRRSVRPNERARFASASPEPRPCARAINYIYASGMVELYRRPCPDGDRAFSRSLAAVAPKPARAHKKHLDCAYTTLDKFYEITSAAALKQVERLQEEEDDAKMRWVRDWTVGATTDVLQSP